MSTRDKSRGRYSPLSLVAAVALATTAITTATLVACRSDATGPDPYFPDGALALDPPPRIYATWWADVEGCSHVSAPFTAVHFYYFPANAFFHVKGDQVLGAWAQRGNKITVAETVTLDSFVVRHEMLHALLQTGEHPPAYFSVACGALIKPPNGGAS